MVKKNEIYTESSSRRAGPRSAFERGFDLVREKGLSFFSPSLLSAFSCALVLGVSLFGGVSVLVSVVFAGDGETDWDAAEPRLFDPTLRGVVGLVGKAFSRMNLIHVSRTIKSSVTQKIE